MTYSPSDQASAAVDLATQPVQIAPGIHWVGNRPPGQIFYANPYLVHTAATATTRGFSMVIDPGSPKEFAVISSKIRQIYPKFDQLDAIYINHQDPDVGSSVGMMLGRYCPKAQVLCSEETWRLIQYYNVPKERFIALDRFEHGMRAHNGQIFLPVPSPFCHFVGAVMLYDPQNRVLFTGDLFGSLTSQDAKGLWADESDWAGMRAFHQLYMPTQQALKLAISKIRALDPPVEIIAPQHGRLLKGYWVEEFMNRLEHLEVGLDLIATQKESPQEKQAWQTVFNRVMSLARELAGADAELLLIEDPVLRNHLEFKGNRLVMNTDQTKRTVERVVSKLTERAPAELAQPIKYEAVVAAHELDLPAPNIDLEDEGAEPTSHDEAPKSGSLFDHP